MPARKSSTGNSRKGARKSKSPSTKAGKYVHEEIEHVRKGKHGARSPEQAIAIGLSKARKAGIKVPPKGKKASAKSSSHRKSKPSAKRSQATTRALKREGTSAASHKQLSKHAHRAAHRTTRKTSGRRSSTSKAHKSGSRRRSASR